MLQPDLVIYLKADPEVLSKRAGYGEERFENIGFQKDVEEGFNKIFERVNKDKLAVVDINGKNLEEVQQSVRQVLKDRL